MRSLAGGPRVALLLAAVLLPAKVAAHSRESLRQVPKCLGPTQS